MTGRITTSVTALDCNKQTPKCQPATTHARLMFMGKKVRRLHSQFEPRHYILELHIQPKTMTFSGSVIISGLKKQRPSQRLTFHQKGLSISNVHVMAHTKNDDKEITIDRINYHKGYDEVRLHSKIMMSPGRYTVTLHFKGTITPQMNGIYPCLFTHQGMHKKLIATQFESHHAREVFPCIDEPAAKATFDLKLIAPKDLTVIANTPLVSQHHKKDVTESEFATTPRMSSYLLAFVIGEMKYLQATTKKSVKVRTYATPGNEEFTKFALSVAVKCLDFFDSYFATDYPLPKCDLVALPDFASGAMENWGCITFREQTLLVDPVNSTLSNKQYVAMVVAHELAHQWFGNLVTMEWWTDLWLNEGFASWIEYLAVDKFFPDWQMWTQFIIDEQQQGLKLDALEHTHPVEVSVDHPDEIRTIFDTISYSKGASVIHMLHRYLGPHDFREGLRYYLKKHAFSNARTEDLWQSLEDISSKPVTRIMQAWTSQAGFPLLVAEVSEKQLKLKQRRFLINPKHSELPDMTWPIPLLANTTALPDMLTSVSGHYSLADPHALKLNAGQSGFYRVTYNATHLEHLGEQVQRGHFSPLDRLSILSDAFETAKAGNADTAEALHLLRYFTNEDNYAVWDIISAALASIRAIMGDFQGIREQMKPFTRNLVSRQYTRLGWKKSKNESHFDQLLRPTILSLSAVADNQEVLEQCRRLFDQSIHSMQTSKVIGIDPDLRGIVFCNVARHGDHTTFEALRELYDKVSLSEERNTLAAALTSFKQPELIDEALSLITSPHVRHQDVSYWIAYSFMNRHARLQAWDWLTSHWQWLETNLGTDLSFYRMPLYVARVSSTSQFITQYKDFFGKHLNAALERPYQQGLEMLQWQTSWRQRDQKEVKRFFELTLPDQ